MPKQTIDISKGWMPDLLPEDVSAVGGLVKARNVLPVSGNYLPVNDKSVYNTTAASGTPIRGYYVQSSDGSFYNFLGTSTKLYRFSKTAMTDVTKVAATYNAVYWDFATYGSWLIATDYEHAPQVLKDLSAGTNFVNLGGTPPKAKYCLMVNGHLILAFIDTGTVSPKKLQWSARENPELWTASLATGAGSQDIPDLMGVITGLAAIGDEFAVFAENSITRGYYMGGQYTFGFKWNYINNIGCFYPSSLISIGNLVFFWSRNSIYMWDGSGYPKEIGSLLKKSVIPNVNFSYSHMIYPVHDKENTLIIWGYPEGSSTIINKLIAYNYAEDKWTGPIEISGSTIFMGNTGGFTIDEVTSIIDTVNIPIDSTYWKGGTINLLVADTDGKIKTLTGTPLESEIESGEFHDNDTVMMVKKAWLSVYGLVGAGSVSLKHRYSPIDAQTASNPASIKSDGSADLRTSNRRMAINMKATDFTRIGKSIAVEVDGTGRR